MLLASQIVVESVVVRIQLVRENLEMLSDVMSSLTGSVLYIMSVEVPVEPSPPLLCQSLKEESFHALQQIEAHKDIAVGIKPIEFAFSHLAVKSPLIGQPLRLQKRIVPMIDFSKMLP